jgi:hypothetical protein
MVYSSCHGAKSYIHRRRRRQMQRRVPSKGHLRQVQWCRKCSAQRQGAGFSEGPKEAVLFCRIAHMAAGSSRMAYIYHRDDRRSISSISVVVLI